MSNLSSELQKVREVNRQREKQYVANWKELLPDGSQWWPGSTGKPGCKVCNGIGWVREDHPFGHPQFGRLLPCECSRQSEPRSEAGPRDYTR
jgi:hypothetical protein